MGRGKRALFRQSVFNNRRYYVRKGCVRKGYVSGSPSTIACSEPVDAVDPYAEQLLEQMSPEQIAWLIFLKQGKLFSYLEQRLLLGEGSGK